MGRKTSVWLPDDLAERVRASGVPMAELIRRGLDAGAPVPLEEMVRGALRAELALSAARGDIPAQSSREEAAPQHGILVRGAVAGRSRAAPKLVSADPGSYAPEDAPKFVSGHGADLAPDASPGTAVFAEPGRDTVKAGGGRDDTRSRSRSAGAGSAARDGAGGERTARDAVPRAAGAAPARGAQPPGRLRCPHPGTRTAGGFCRKCDSRVEPGGWLPDGWGSRHDR